MRRSVLTSVLVAGALAAGAVAFVALRAPETAGRRAFRSTTGHPPLVVLVIVDTLRKDALSLYAPKAPPTPSIDAFAARSTVYERAMAPSSWTTPSVAAILTSKLPTQLGLKHELRRLSNEAVLLSERFEEAGFTTVGVVSNRYCSARWGFAQGYDEFDESTIKQRTFVTSDQVTDVALDRLDAHPDEPVFLMVHYVDPHVSYNEHPDYLRNDPAYTGPVQPPVHWEWLVDNRRKLQQQDWERLRAIYASEVAWTDAQVGRLFEGITARGRMQDALVVFTHDHGEEFSDHGSIGHGYNLYEEAVASPLIVHYPASVAAPGRVSAPVSLLDIGPTALDLMGLEVPEDLRGQDLLEHHDPNRPIRAETDRGGSEVRAVRIGDRKIIRWLRRTTVYDLAADPSEQDGRPPTDADADLVDALAAWPAPELAASDEPIDLDEMEREMLEAVGYLEGN